MIFKSYQGQAKLIHETTDKSWSCEVQIEQLINGRVIAKCIIFPADKELEKLDLSLTGTLEDQFEFKCIGLQFRKSALVTSGKNFFKHEFVYDIMSAELTNLTIEKPETVNLEVHLTNFRWYHKKQIDFELKGYQCQLENMRTDNEAEDSAAYYQHPMIKSILHLKKVKFVFGNK